MLTVQNTINGHKYSWDRTGYSAHSFGDNTVKYSSGNVSRADVMSALTKITVNTGKLLSAICIGAEDSSNPDKFKEKLRLNVVVYGPIIDGKNITWYTAALKTTSETPAGQGE